MPRLVPILTATALLTALTTARAEDSLTRWITADYFSSTRTLDDTEGAGSFEAGIKYLYDLNQANTFNFDGNLRHELPEDTTQLTLVEANWQYRGDWVDLWVGQQKIAWGKADGLNPTDFFTPHDYTVIQPLEEDQRLSVPAVRVDVVLDSGQTVSLVTQMFFIESTLPAPADMSIDERSPDNDWPQIGLRWASTGQTWDWSVSAFQGMMNMPVLSPDATTDRGLSLFYHYPELTAFGADFARNFGKYGFRAEAAWLIPKEEDGRLGIEPYGFLVAGFDRGEDDWNVNLQLVARHTPNRQDPSLANPIIEAVSRQNSINFGQMNREQFGLTCRIAANWLNQTVQAEIFAIHYFHPDNTFVRPLASYAVNDNDKLTIGGEHYRGPQDSYYGQLEENNTFFIEYKHFF